MKYRAKLGIIIVVLSILFMVGGTILCVELKVNPLLGIGIAFVLVVMMIMLIPNKIMTYDQKV